MKITIRADSVQIEGYVNAVGRDSRKITDEYGNAFVEQIRPGVFGMALNRAKEDIPVLLDHDPTRRLGDTGSNLKLEEDTIGLHADVLITDPAIVELARSQKLSGWSFGFIPLDTDVTYDYDNHVERRVVTELELHEVSIIDDAMTPVYAGTSIHARANDNKKITLRAMDNDTVAYISEEVAPVQEPVNTENRAKEPQKPVDYKKYHETIGRLRR